MSSYPSGNIRMQLVMMPPGSSARLPTSAQGEGGTPAVL